MPTPYRRRTHGHTTPEIVVINKGRRTRGESDDDNDERDDNGFGLGFGLTRFVSLSMKIRPQGLAPRDVDAP